MKEVLDCMSIYGKILTGASELLSKLWEVLPFVPSSFIGIEVILVSAARSEIHPRICSHDINYRNVKKARPLASQATTVLVNVGEQHDNTFRNKLRI